MAASAEPVAEPCGLRPIVTSLLNVFVLRGRKTLFYRHDDGVCAMIQTTESQTTGQWANVSAY